MAEMQETTALERMGWYVRLADVLSASEDVVAALPFAVELEEAA